MINRVIINGNLGKDPEITKTSGGKSVCNVSICQNRKDQNGNQFTEWFRIEAWERTADFLGQYCRKGDMILVDGHMKFKEWMKDGERRTAEAIIADTITLERRGQNHVDNAQPVQARQNTQPSTYGQPIQYAEPQQTYTAPIPAYTQPSMMPGNTVPAQANGYDLPEWSKGVDIESDDLPF